MLHFVKEWLRNWLASSSPDKAVARAVTRRRHAEETLHLSEERFRLMVEAVQDYAIFMLDPEGRVASWNQGAERIKGYLAEEIIGQHFRRFYPQEAIDRRWPEQELELAQAQGRFEDEGWRIRQDGSRFWANVVITTLRNKDGSLRGFCKVTRDLTERRQAEDKLRQANAELEEQVQLRTEALIQERESLQTTLMSIGDAVIVTDLQGRVTHLNPVAQELTGWSQAEAEGQPLETVFRICNEQTRQTVENPVARVLRTGLICGLANHTVLISRDGTERPIDDSGAPIKDTRGQVSGVVLVFRDVSERRRVEEERLRLAAVVESSEDAIISKDLDGLITSWNQGAERLFGYTAAEVIGQPVSMLIPPGQPNELPEILARLRRGERIEHYETVRQRKDGRRLTVALSISPIKNAAGDIIGAAKIAHDVTASKQAEQQLQRQNQRLRLLWESASVLLSTDAPDPMLRALFAQIGPHLGVDAYLNYMVNEAGDALRLESSMGFPDEALRSLHRLEFGQAICGTAAQRRQPMLATHIQQSDDPHVQPAKGLGIRAYFCNPLLAGDRLLGTLSFASRTRDEFEADEQEFMRTICRYVAAAYERLRLIGQLREADRRKNEFLAMLSHELRNPLAPVRNALQILKMPTAPANAAVKAREMMERQVQQLVRLVDDLLDVSRIMRDRIELRKERIDLATLIDRAIETAHPIIDAQGHELSVALPPGPLYLEGDLIRLAQAVSNLLMNAAKYTDRAGRIWLTAERDGGEVAIRVRDSGVGINPELLPRIFDLFVQADRSLARSQGGLGIGLTLVKRLVELHGGTVTAASPGQGQGSEFTLRLPVLPESRSGGGATPLPGRVRQRGPQRRVLVVDDNVDAAESAALLLRAEGHDVRTIYDGHTVLDAVREFRPMIVLLDIGLPGISGYDVARRLREQPDTRGLILVAMTGYGQDEDRRRSHEAGFNLHLTKPMDPSALPAIIAATAPQPVS